MPPSQITTRGARARAALGAAVLLLALSAGEAAGQCILANPSFEIAGSSGETFEAWNEFGSVGFSVNATHGARAARVSGPDLGGWDLSAFWQRLDAAPGDRWSASACAWHPSTKPLNGQSRAILNIEWRDANGDLIDYESHTVVDASTPTDEVVVFTVESGAAPATTVATHFLLGVLQGPSDSSPDVFYDQATFDNLGPPTLDDVQWNDFSSGRRLEFSGRTWRVKGPGWYGPGPNRFCESAACTWVDADGRLHMTLQNINGSWYSTEVTLEEALGYGDYVFTTHGRLDTLDPQVVLGLFLWQYGPCYLPANGWWNPYNEIDIEFSRWGDPANDIGHFVAQPYDWPGNGTSFDATFSDGERTSHAMRWLPDRLEYRSWRGGPHDESPANLIHSWTYAGPHVPRPEQPRVHVNLWKLAGSPSANQEVIVDAFTFVAACTGPHCDVATSTPPASPAVELAVARPNPFNPQTTITYALPAETLTEIVVYDAAGRRIRTLVRELVGAGTHTLVWRGDDDSGKPVASGVYFYTLRAAGVVKTQRTVLLK